MLGYMASGDMHGCTMSMIMYYQIYMGIQSYFFEKKLIFCLSMMPYLVARALLPAQTCLKATSSGSLKVAQNILFFGATSLTSWMSTSGLSGLMV